MFIKLCPIWARCLDCNHESFSLTLGKSMQIMVKRGWRRYKEITRFAHGYTSIM